MADILQDVDVTDNPILLHCELGTTVGLRASLIKHGQVEEIPFEVVDELKLWNEFAYTRLTCTLEINCAENEDAVKEALQKLRVYVRSLNILHCGFYCIFLYTFCMYSWHQAGLDSTLKTQTST